MRRKIFITYIILILFAVAIVGSYSIYINQVVFRENIKQRLLTNAKLIQYELSEKSDGHVIDIQAIADRYSELTGARVTIVYHDGTVLADSSRNAADMDNHADRPEVNNALNGKAGESIRYSSSLKTDMMYVALPVRTHNNIKTAIRLAMSLKEINHTSGSIIWSIVLAIIASLLVSLIQASLFSKSITEPIRRLSDASRVIARGNFENKIQVKTNDEIGELSDSFNQMADRLKVTMDQLNRENIKLESILSSMVNGVLAVDNSKNILLANGALKALFSIREEIVGKQFIQVVRSDLIDSMIDQTLVNGEVNAVEMSWSKGEFKQLKVSVAPIQRNGLEGEVTGAVVLIQDITELKKLEQMRKDFVANVSHEIKTPLTSIKGFVETLKNGAIEDKDVSMKFLNIIDIEVERLTRLISDILALSEIERSRVVESGKKVDVGHVIKDVVDVLKEQAGNKKIALKYSFDEGVSICSSKDRIKQLFLNLADNAIKYTPEGGSVFISAHKKDGFVTIKVEDNGIGIDQEHIPRLFERFYRVDKGRSRNLGGTGLGLAIVKHIVASLNGNIVVESKKGKGTSFIVNMPEGLV
ncbi:MAG: ATP-binding protein [Clostridia bacterium]|nr:ATP-binding protein [Clostridia bacterium]